MTLDLEIGGLSFSLREPEGRLKLCWPAEAYEPFLRREKRHGLAFEVRVVEQLPELARGERLYDSGPGLWTLRRSGDGLLLESRDTQSPRVFNRAWLSPDYSEGRIFTRAEADGAWNPSRVINPVVEVCLLTRLARQGGLMLHVAGVECSGAGYCFAGPSGSGKTTLSGLFIERGALILNDERVILTEVGRRPMLHGTPWCGSNPAIRNASAPLAGLFFLRHGSRSHRLRELGVAEAIGLCLRQAFLPHWDRQAMEASVESARALSSRVEPVEFAFLKEPGAVDAIFGHAQTRVPAVP